jgi:hypothetical protein
MIKSLTSSSPYLHVQNGYNNVPPISPGAQSAGILRYNSNNNTIEVYNGVAWFSIDTNINLNLSEAAHSALTWAEIKMREEARLKDLMSRHPGLKELHDKFEMMRVLCQEEEKQQ